jgi:hypothetical protein
VIDGPTLKELGQGEDFAARHGRPDFQELLRRIQESMAAKKKP